jgi:hypothetical protein
MKEIELNEHGKLVFKHKTNKRLFLDRSYRWVDRLILLDETDGRQVIDEFKYSTFDLSAWEPMTKEEFDSVKSSYKEIYGTKSKSKSKDYYTCERCELTSETKGSMCPCPRGSCEAKIAGTITKITITSIDTKLRDEQKKWNKENHR